MSPVNNSDEVQSSPAESKSPTLDGIIELQKERARLHAKMFEIAVSSKYFASDSPLKNGDYFHSIMRRVIELDNLIYRIQNPAASYQQSAQAPYKTTAGR